ncbi:MAG TPA: BREX-1 system adenine-specific DNA-methyltransferase PglX, partial [Clostridiales bacterium]|nr:BREX-1 system adenine-specific DNA-methyltransferase PglX [Clostridiales bacterium]
MNKTAIKNFAIWARQKLISDITYKAGLIGITEKGIAQPLAQSTNDLQFFDIGTKNYADISGKEIAQRNALIAAIKNKERDTDYKTALQNVVEEVAYTWFNRLIAVRFMEVNDYLPSRIRVLSSENPAKLEPDFVTTPFETDLEFTPYEKDRVIQLKDENKLDELFRLLFIKQCNKLNTILPELFEKTDDYSELLLTISFTDKDGVVYHLTHDIEEDDFNVSKEGQVEIIGWLYQYYNTEPKQAVFDGLKKNIKITKEKIPAATQLFTPHWIVRYMVENSLGRLWLESKQVNGQAAPTAADFGWKYYVEEAEQEPEVLLRLKALRAENRVKSPEDIKLIDPCMGSGHILVYAFDVLMQIYESEGYAPRDAAKLILQKNLYGLDIDKRAYQLAYFSLMMKGRRHNRKLLNEEVSPQVYQPAGYQEGEEYG